MNNETKTIPEDDREIAAIYTSEEGGLLQRVGKYDCTKIVAYGEKGLHCYWPIFAVYFGDDIKYRVPATQVIVEYAD